MFDIGWTELLVIAVVLIVVVGPKDLPPMLRAFGKTMTRFRKVAGEFRAQFDEALKEADLDEVRQHISDAQKLNPANSLREAMNPLRQMGNEIKADLQRSTTVDRPQTAETQMLPAAPVAPTPEIPVETPPVIAPPPEALADATSTKPKAVRKPRATKTAAAPVAIETAEVAAAKPKRAPRKAAAGLSITETVITEAQGTSAAEQEASAMLVEPAQVGLSEAAAKPKPKRAPRKTAAAVVAEEAPVAPKKATAPRKPTKKKDDA